MCGRFTQRFSWQQVHDYMYLLGGPVELTPRYNVAPGQQVAAVRASGDGRRLSMLRWGLLPAWAKDPNIGYRPTLSVFDPSAAGSTTPRTMIRVASNRLIGIGAKNEIWSQPRRTPRMGDQVVRHGSLPFPGPGFGTQIIRGPDNSNAIGANMPARKKETNT